MTLNKCRKCGIYTMKPACPSCGGNTGKPGPAKYSPEDRFGKYRRQLRRLEEGK
ncbi:MAG: RNA-protein complex protein Nop10 [Euryarchaeota archaeon]|nr:RNA-protein complex protein Nop10 [Euryarchaeota archaeon]